jgi:hypothetical protein
MQQGYHNLAYDRALRALQKDGQNYSAHLVLAMLAFKAGDQATRQRHLQQSQLADQSQEEKLVWLRFLLQEQQCKKANDYYHQYLAEFTDKNTQKLL